jgi:hypothetical protein
MLPRPLFQTALGGVAGSVGSADGSSSILIWTEAGQQAFQHVVPRLEITDLERPQAIEKLAGGIRDGMPRKRMNGLFHRRTGGSGSILVGIHVLLCGFVLLGGICLRVTALARGGGITAAAFVATGKHERQTRQ